MKKALPLLWVGLLAMMSAFAQNEQDRINNIKKSLDFIYATGTSTTCAEDASSNAKELLSLEIEQWLKENSKGEHTGYVAKAANNLSEIKTKKGNLFRVFVYVKKTDILSFGKDNSILMVTTYDDTLKKTMDTVKILTQNNDYKPLKPLNVAPNDLPLPAPVPATSSEKEIIAIRNLSEINTYIAKGHKNGVIRAYGKYDSNTRLFSKTYFFLINKDGDVVATLKKEGNEVVNLVSGMEDSIEKHGRCGVIWFQLAE